jgi:hypothetical protein
LDDFALCGNVSRSAEAAQVGRAVIYRWLRQDPQFKERFDEAQLDAADWLEEEARRRASMDGSNPSFQMAST